MLALKMCDTALLRATGDEPIEFAYGGDAPQTQGA